MSISYLHNEQCDFAKLLLYSRSSFLHLLLDRGRSLWRKSNILYTHFVGRTYSVNSCWQVVEGCEHCSTGSKSFFWNKNNYNTTILTFSTHLHYTLLYILQMCCEFQRSQYCKRRFECTWHKVCRSDTLAEWAV